MKGEKNRKLIEKWVCNYSRRCGLRWVENLWLEGQIQSMKKLNLVGGSMGNLPNTPARAVEEAAQGLCLLCSVYSSAATGAAQEASPWSYHLPCFLFPPQHLLITGNPGDLWLQPGTGLQAAACHGKRLQTPCLRESLGGQAMMEGLFRDGERTKYVEPGVWWGPLEQIWRSRKE